MCHAANSGKVRGRAAFTFMLLILLLAPMAWGQLPFNDGDWISYLDSRQVAALDFGHRYIFAATKGGVLVYDAIKNRWEDPQTVGYAISEAVPLMGAVALIYDEETDYLWVCSEREVFRWHVGSRRWKWEAQDLWSPGERVVNMGIGSKDIYIEVIPGPVYAQLFVVGSPLPRSGWQSYVRRFSGSRQFGGFGMELSDPDLTDDVRWRGLRSKVPLTSEERFGRIGIGPAGFPDLRLPDGAFLLPTGEVQDKYLRVFPITDWLVDRWGNFWFSTWGVGLGKADIRSLFTEMFAFGLAGNHVQALLLSARDIWIGGDNEAPLLGITRSSRDLRRWQVYEPRAERQILSTIVYDFAETDESVWVATEEGLLQFEKKKGNWRRYGVRDGLWSDRIRALAADNSQLWVGTDRGLNLISLPGMTVWRHEHTTLRDVGVLRLTLLADTLYVGTPNGLFRGSVVNREFSYFPLDPGLMAAPVRDISIVGDEVWAVTRQGVQVYNSATGQTRSWHADLYLGGDSPTCILASQQAVWVGTGNGFWRWWRDRNEWIDYGTRDGLVNESVEIIRRDGDDLLIGTASGLTRFFWNDPKRLK